PTESTDPFFYAFHINNTFYISEYNRGLLIKNDADVLEMAPGGEAMANTHIPYVMLPYDEQRILVGTIQNGLYQYYSSDMGDQPVGTFQPFPNEVNERLQAANVVNGVVLKNGDFAIGTNTAGVFIINQLGELVQVIDKAAGLNDEEVTGLFEDRQ